MPLSLGAAVALLNFGFQSNFISVYFRLQHNYIFVYFRFQYTFTSVCFYFSVLHPLLYFKLYLICTYSFVFCVFELHLLV
jgi:hypothetical protein